MPETRKKYDREFREGAVRIVEETSKPIAQVARDLGVNEGTLGNWVQRARAAREGHGELSKDDYEELKRLRAEVAELRMERDVLKRSVVLWVKERRSERGPLHRRPADQLPGATHGRLRPPRGIAGVVLQVDQARHRSRRRERLVHRHRPAPRQRGPGRQGRVQGRQGAARLPAPARRPARRRLGDQREDRRGVDAPPGPHRRRQAARRPDQAGQVQEAVPGPAVSGLHRAGAELPVGRRHHRDPYGRGQAVPGHRDRPVLAPAAWRGDQQPPRCRTGGRGDPDGGGRPRRQGGDLARGRGRASRVPHRSRKHGRNQVVVATPRSRRCAGVGSSRKPWPQRPEGARRQWAADRALRPAMRSPGRPEPSRAVQRPSRTRRSPTPSTIWGEPHYRGLNALAESTIGSFKTEQINRNGPWRDVNHVELATFEWVDFFNTQRPHESLEDLTPALVEQIHYAHRTPSPRQGETDNRVSGHSGAA